MVEARWGETSAAASLDRCGIPLNLKRGRDERVETKDDRALERVARVPVSGEDTLDRPNRKRDFPNPREDARDHSVADPLQFR